MHIITINTTSISGAIDVSYIAENGNMSSLGTDTNLASQGMDFISEVRTVRLEDGQQSAAISIHIIDVNIIRSSSSNNNLN